MKKKRLIIPLSILGVFVLVLVAVTMYIFVPTHTGEFKRAYVSYALLSERHDALAFLPGSEGNEKRQELFAVLSEALVGEITSGERREYARVGLALLSDTESDIDAMGSAMPVIENAIERMRGSVHFFASQKTRSISKEIIERAEHRLAVIADIRGLSYRANFHTEEIFRRILEDGGALTREHAVFLNEQIPLIEEQFDERLALYQDLEKTRNEIAKRAHEL